MREDVKRLYAEARSAHFRLYQIMLGVQREVLNSADLQELGDTVFGLRQVETILEDSRKETSELLRTVEKVCTLRWVADAANKHEPIRTEYCTASPDLKQTVKVSGKGTPEYKLMLAHFGIPEDAPFAPHWPTLLKRIDADMKAGLPVPPGCDPNQMQQVCVVRTLKRKKPILEEGQAIDLGNPECLRQAYELFNSLKALPVDLLRALASTLNVELMRGLASGVDHIAGLVEADDQETERQNAEAQAELDADRKRVAQTPMAVPAPSFMDADCEGAAGAAAGKEETPF